VKLTRRYALVGGAAVALGAALPLWFRSRRQGRAPSLPASRDIDDLLVREGFSVQVLDRTGDLMSDGFRVPGAPDGMAAFDGGDGTIVLMRNHELIGQRALSARPDGDPPEVAYSQTKFGAVTRLVLSNGVSAADVSVLSSNLALTGTANNCAGGASPWGWLTCEEYSDELEHGYVFACDHRKSELAAPVKIPAYGRLRHEAVGIDPQTFDAYLSEDRYDGCLYRFVARSKETPFEGQLQAMALDVPSASQLAPGERAAVRWVDVDGADVRSDDLRARAVRAGAATIARGEGVFAELRDGRTRVLVVATVGGRRGRGQVLELTPTRDGGTLTCLVEAPGGDALDMPDNVCVAPSGHVFLAEDGPSQNGVVVACPSGALVPLLVNTGEGEIAGVTHFSGLPGSPPHGDDKLFLNLQQRGLTLVVSGPFSSLA
jgi:uncharacterized protein